MGNGWCYYIIAHFEKLTENKERIAYLVLAYPEIEQSDYDLIQKYRKKNGNLFYFIVKPHFIIVFPVLDQKVSEFLTEIEKFSKKRFV